MSYYIPDIQDIRVGYELEYRDFGGVWKKDKISSFKDTWNVGRLYEMRHMVENERFRVPYLSKEDIIKDGWEHKETVDHLEIFEKKSNVPDQIEDGITFKLILSYPGVVVPWVTIELVKARYSDKNPRVYQGRCRSINELRVISKYLNIK